jgi:CRISPR-associated protein Cmr2
MTTANAQRNDALLSFSLGPVQTFIGAARSVRDLWTGSYLLSWLTFRALLPVLEQHGPGALVFPDVSENPLWLWEQKKPLQDRLTLLEPCLPNRFLAEVPADGRGLSAGEEGAACR